MELNLKDLKKIPIINFGIDKILSEKICKFVLICLDFSGTPLFFIRIPENQNDDFPIIFNHFINEITEQFSLQINDIKKFISEDSGGYLWILNKNGKMKICASYLYGIESDHEFTTDLLKKELKL